MAFNSTSFRQRGAGQEHRGLTPKELAIMDRWDAGKSINQIARELGRPVEQVRKLVIYYDGAADQHMSNRATAAASAQLLHAIQRERAA
ncbi:hypothetical protein [Novosphingobium sp.]|uniref:hypothetical protein n=1 Tax=Novosphingobium sp. TaxID=1874826 RepID=UPI0026249754|nr:hypothetical protein [Novosphingobium sp.]